MTKQTAGQRLAAQYADALARASREQGRTLEWDEAESVALAKAVECADRGDQLRALLDRELARPEPRPHTVTILSAEVRLLNKAMMDYLWRLNTGVGKAKSPQHVAAGRRRWEVHRLPSADGA